MNSTAKPPRAVASERASRPRQRQRLIDACISALHEYGPSRTTIDKVVAIADMSPGIVNFYFDTKAALLIACLEHLAQEFEEDVLSPIQALRAVPAAALDKLIDLYLDQSIASPRKVSVWYAFWGEANARAEYFTICGKRDLAFADLVRDIIAARIAERGDTHLDADAIALGLIGCLEMQWQEIAFREEPDIDRARMRRRCRAYLASVFPAYATQAVSGNAMLIAAQLCLAGVPAAPLQIAGQPACVLAHPKGSKPQSIAVRTEPGVTPDLAQHDWIAFILPGGIYILPNARLKKLRPAGLVENALAPWRNNFTLSALQAH
jgi:TetR/AcrR family transcriptional repressor of bet genes